MPENEKENARQRLIDLIVSADISLFGSDKPFAEVYADILLANGVLVPPCKVGDDVYSIVATYGTCHLGSKWDMCMGCIDVCDSHATYSILQESVVGVLFDGAWRVRTTQSHGHYKTIGEPIYGVLLSHEAAEKALTERKKRAQIPLNETKQ